MPTLRASGERNPASAESAGRIVELNDRSREIFRHIVESYLETGEPVGSRNLSRHLPMTLSPASVRNVMSDLEQLGLIYAPHTSAGRLPTHLGLRLFVDGILEVGDISDEERRRIERHVLTSSTSKKVDDMLAEAGELISGLSLCAGLVLADKHATRLKHIEFVQLEPARALVVLVSEEGTVENRIIKLPEGLPPASLAEASKYLNTHIQGLTLDEARSRIERELADRTAQLDALTAKVIEEGLASWAGEPGDRKSLIVRGQSNLLKDVTAIDDLERIRRLFDDLETKRELISLLESAETAEGVKIFIGSENRLFSLSGSSLIVAPLKDPNRKIVGALGVIGPTRLNYSRIIPMVDFTARLIGKLLS
jgi:heat-inducible transcriptional repressor